MAVVALAPSCSSGGDDRASPSTVTTQATSTSSSVAETSTSTVASTTSTTSRPTSTTSAASTPEGRAQALYGAWTRADRGPAAAVAQAEAVSALFARPWQASDGWTFSECTGAAGSMICSWRSPAGQQVLFRVQSAAGGAPMVSEVRFQP